MPPTKHRHCAKGFFIFGSAIFFLCIGFYGGYIYRPRGKAIASQLRLNGNYTFINPLLLSDASELKDSREFTSLKSKAQELLEKHKSSGDATQTSLYFRDLNGGRWFGVGENDIYAPASMLKVPTMIAFYKLAETNPKILSAVVTYKGGADENKDESIKPLKAIEPGKSYTIEELIHYMIAYSDNNARLLLHENIDPKYLLEVFTDLGIDIPANSDQADFMSPKKYSYFYRILYNGTYLSRTMSEKALSLLSTPDFPQGLEAGVPTDTVVAQKFGERQLADPKSNEIYEKELHDCGIIYYPKSPYLLCVMTKGPDLSRLSSVIADISRLIYAEIQTTKRG